MNVFNFLSFRVNFFYFIFYFYLFQGISKRVTRSSCDSDKTLPAFHSKDRKVAQTVKEEPQTNKRVQTSKTNEAKGEGEAENATKKAKTNEASSSEPPLRGKINVPGQKKHTIFLDSNTEQTQQTDLRRGRSKDKSDDY